MSTKPEQLAVAYLDLGVGGYMDIGTDLTDEELDTIPKGRHMLGIVGTYGIEGYVPAQPAPKQGAVEMNELTQAALDVLAERRRQIEAEGWTPEHDDEHVNDEIAAMAALYAMPEGARDWDASSTGYGDTLQQAMVPSGWYMPTFRDRRNQLIKAGALILAEIERLDRMATAKPEVK